MSIRVENLIHIYDKGMPTEQLALDNISFAADDGRMVGIIGHTGSGKSTLLQHLNGLLRPDSGKIIIGDTDITQPGVSMVEIRKKIGLVFQYPEYQLFEETVAKDVAFGPKNLGLSREEIDERVREAIELVGLDYEEMKDRSPFELSGGQKRRVAIAGILAMKPEVLVLDEPAAGLDPKGRREILGGLCEYIRQSNTTLILVSHSMEDMAHYCDDVVVMNDSKVFKTGSVKEIFSDAKSLESIGLDVPVISKITSKLIEKGINLEGELYTVEGAVRAILDFRGRARK